MDNNSNENLTLDEKITDIKVAMKETKNIRMYKRYLVILKYLEGNSNVDIAKMVLLEKHAVGDYIRKYKANGLTGLEMKHGTGAPRKLSKEQETLLFETITNRTPDEVGFESRKNWTIEIARQWIINTFAVNHSHRGTHEVLRRLNLSYTRPTYVLKKADKEKQEEFKVTFEGLKKTYQWGD
jgi:transposase